MNELLIVNRVSNSKVKFNMVYRIVTASGVYVVIYGFRSCNIDLSRLKNDISYNNNNNKKK